MLTLWGQFNVANALLGASVHALPGAVRPFVPAAISHGRDEGKIVPAGAAYSRYGARPIGAILGAEFFGSNANSSADVAPMAGWCEVAPSIVLPNIVEMIHDQRCGVMRGFTSSSSSTRLPIDHPAAVMARMRPETDSSKQHGPVFMDLPIGRSQRVPRNSEDGISVPFVHNPIIAHARKEGKT